jgi:hypothetical protein
MTTFTDLRRFFEAYAQMSLGTNPKELAAAYAPTFLVAGPQGSQAFKNDRKFVKWLRELHEFNQARGMRGLSVVELRESPLSPRHTLATVRWGAVFEKTGDRRIEFDIAYLLERSDDRWTILAYVSQSDQEAAMKEEGLL